MKGFIVKFENDDFSSEEKKEIIEYYSWMEKYYSTLVGARIENISISVASEPRLYAFPCFTFQLRDGRTITAELTSILDECIPGFMLGLDAAVSNN